MANEKLPEDLAMEVLCRLPVKSLLRFKSVSKNWYSLIQNPRFISLHHNYAASNAAARNTDCLLVKRSINGGDGKVILSLVPNETPTEDIDVAITGLDFYQLELLGPCNGVVCLTRLGYYSTVTICNPSIREFRVLPQPPYNKKLYVINLGFGFDPYTNDYKVVKFGYPNQGCPSHIEERIEIYELSTDSWRIVDAVSPVKFGFYCWTSVCTSWNGDIYWYASCRNGDETIIVFRMSDEVFDEIPVPELCFLKKSRDRKFLAVNDSLALVFDLPGGEFLFEKCFDIWVMDVQGVEVSWTKKFTIGPFSEPNTALGFRQNGEFLLEKVCGRMISYHIETRQIKEYQVCGYPPIEIQVLLYIESLVSVKRHNQHDGPNDLDS